VTASPTTTTTPNTAAPVAPALEVSGVEGQRNSFYVTGFGLNPNSNYDLFAADAFVTTVMTDNAGSFRSSISIQVSSIAPTEPVVFTVRSESGAIVAQVAENLLELIGNLGKVVLGLLP
jgi:hypothetical protein